MIFYFFSSEIEHVTTNSFENVKLFFCHSKISRQSYFWYTKGGPVRRKSRHFSLSFSQLLVCRHCWIHTFPLQKASCRVSCGNTEPCWVLSHWLFQQTTKLKWKSQIKRRRFKVLLCLCCASHKSVIATAAAAVTPPGLRLEQALPFTSLCPQLCCGCGHNETDAGKKYCN